MKRRITVLLVSAMTFGVMQLGMATPASACADPNCPWSPVTDYVADTLYWVGRACDTHVGPIFVENPCP